MLRLSAFYLLFKAGFINVKKLHEATLKNFFADLPADTVDDHASQFLSQKLNDLIYLPAYNKLQEAKEDGSYTAILSSAPNFLVEKVASKLGVDTWDATIYQKNHLDHFSHISQYMEGASKAESLLQLVEDLKIKKEDVTAYTDSYLDLPLLQAAGRAIGVNPDRRLKAICRRRQWPII
jgi:phosphoserine phosphatase